jgi:hypothetical protein
VNVPWTLENSVYPAAVDGIIQMSDKSF